MKHITTPDAPLPAGHYSQAVVHNGTVYVAGQLPIVPGATTHVVGDMEQQVTQTFANVRAILRAAGSDLDQLLSVTIYVSDIELWPAVNAAYIRVMGNHKPARAGVPVKELHYGYQIEVSAIAAVRA